MRLRTLAILFLQVSLTACQQPPAASKEVAHVVGEAQQVVAETTVSPIVAVREVVESVAPIASTIASRCVVSPEGVALIVRFEITSRAYYDSRLQGVMWPGVRSGVTWGVGYDGGYYTREGITRDWARHAQVGRLASTSGVVGAPAKALIPSLADIRTPYPMAEEVFVASMLPVYCELAKRTFRNGWDGLTQHAKDSLVATVFNRGAGMGGESRVEMKVLRDTCVPAADTRCMAAQYRSMPRVWRGTSVEAGLTKRYNETAKLALLEDN